MSKYNVGDIVTTTETLSYWGTPIPPGPKRVCALFESRGEVGIEDIPKTPNRNYVLKVDQVQPYAPTFKPGDWVTTDQTPATAPQAKPKAGTGWTFRIPADEPIDGKRVLKELADAGADYAVVSWGKRDDQRLCLVSQQLAERAQRLEVARGTNILNPDFIVPDFGRGYYMIGLAKDSQAGYCYAGDITLAELADYAKRVKDAERAKRPTTVRVNFGVAK